METVEYAAGRLATVFGGPAQPTVLIWHGKQPNASAVVRPLAELVARHGVGVVVPDWNSHADDGGRADLCSRRSLPVSVSTTVRVWCLLAGRWVAWRPPG